MGLTVRRADPAMQLARQALQRMSVADLYATTAAERLVASYGITLGQAAEIIQAERSRRRV